MSKSIDPSIWNRVGGEAFPVPESESCREWDGVSLQDYFAGKAMASLAHDILIEQHWEDVLKKQGVEPDELPLFLAHMSYNVADAMLKERAKRSNETPR